MTSALYFCFGSVANVLYLGSREALFKTTAAKLSRVWTHPVWLGLFVSQPPTALFAHELLPCIFHVTAAGELVGDPTITGSVSGTEVAM